MHEPDICDNRNDSQDVFAKVAIDLFASFANHIDMKDLDAQQRRWLSEQLKAKGRGAKSALAKHLRLEPSAVTRMINLHGKGESREISFSELVGIAEFFKDEPPGMAAARSAADVAPRSPATVRMVPMLDKIAAGKLAAPMSQIPMEDVPLLAFADLGRGEFFALKVEGDSMDRLSPEGSVIVVNRAEREPIRGKPYVFFHRTEGTTFKLWEPKPARLEPHSWNAVNKPIYIERRRDYEVVGRVRRSVLDL